MDGHETCFIVRGNKPPDPVITLGDQRGELEIRAPARTSALRRRPLTCRPLPADRNVSGSDVEIRYCAAGPAMLTYIGGSAMRIRALPVIGGE
ncbi:hypothetical protein [uncultured Mycobacterium sp.]|uniref:hypothetical protein n=1 Tax=uncultured Mycobacterium sp. TaxID=171292 RepID=UPI0035CAF8D0